jgi:hypothetical protein
MRACHLCGAVGADIGNSDKSGTSIKLWIVAAAVDAMSDELRVGPALSRRDVPDGVVGTLQGKSWFGAEFLSHQENFFLFSAW